MTVRSNSRVVRQNVIRVEFDFTRDELATLLVSLDRDINSLSHPLPKELKRHLAYALKCADTAKVGGNGPVESNESR